MWRFLKQYLVQVPKILNHESHPQNILGLVPTCTKWKPLYFILVLELNSSLPWNGPNSMAGHHLLCDISQEKSVSFQALSAWRVYSTLPFLLLFILLFPYHSIWPRLILKLFSVHPVQVPVCRGGLQWCRRGRWLAPYRLAWSFWAGNFLGAELLGTA